MVEEVANFKYLVHPLYQMEYGWLEVIHKFKWAWRFWGMLDKILKREGADPKVEKKLKGGDTVGDPFFLETWVLSAEMEITVEGTHIGFMRKITGKRARWKADGT